LNWLQAVIHGSNCLDLFAGTGALGFEALSRGANSVVMVEQNRSQCDELRKQAKILGADGAKIVYADGLKWLDSSSQGFDIIFLDPPFAENVIAKACEKLTNKRHLHRESRLYIESSLDQEIKMKDFKVLKQSRAGQVQYQLIKPEEGLVKE